ncbi:MAG: hypothetical protein BWY82_00599 [Verrucomicrobia bacterium ADurb.Bin474]|nr:MAG: hypothetical protein BWY82_00599 [Verrucomicrobia bacterium ADurb.Bin474]
MLWLQDAGFIVQGRDLLTIAGRTRDDFAPTDLSGIKRMQGLPHLMQYEICHVHHIVDRTKPDRLQPLLQPIRTLRDLYTPDAVCRVILTGRTVLDLNSVHQCIPFRNAQGCFHSPDNRTHPLKTKKRRQFTGHTDMAQAVRTIRCHFHVKYRIRLRKYRIHGSPDFRPLFQNKQARMVLAHAQLARAAHHALAVDVTQLGLLDHKSARQFGTRKRNRDTVPDLEIPGTANDLGRCACPHVHFTQAQAIRIRMLCLLKHLANHHMLQRSQPTTFDTFNLKTDESQCLLNLFGTFPELRQVSSDPIQ